MFVKYCFVIWMLIYLQTCSSQLYQNGSEFIVNNELLRISEGSEKFAFELFSRISKTFDAYPSKVDFMLSPFSVWSLLLLLVEGTRGDTLSQLQNVLGIHVEPIFLREGYKRIQSALNVNTTTIEVSTLQSIFSDINRPVERDYELTITELYKASMVPVDFSRTSEAKVHINSFVERATKGQIRFLVNADDLTDAQMVMISAIFFKGQWKFPFNKTLTREEPFYDEDGKLLGTVPMMYRLGTFTYTNIKALDAHVLELPYGKENRLSMIIILPRKGISLSSTITKLGAFGLTNIFVELKKSFELIEEEEEELEVFLPRFTTQTHLTLNSILQEMGISDLFYESADLTKISQHPIFLSRLIHKTKIEVNEEGTIASAASGASFINKASPTRFLINRPFSYIIVEKSTNSLLFCGQIQNPTNKK